MPAAEGVPPAPHQRAPAESSILYQPYYIILSTIFQIQTNSQQANDGAVKYPAPHQRAPAENLKLIFAPY